MPAGPLVHIAGQSRVHVTAEPETLVQTVVRHLQALVGAQRWIAEQVPVGSTPNQLPPRQLPMPAICQPPIRWFSAPEASPPNFFPRPKGKS